MSYTKNLTVKELYASIFPTPVIDDFFRTGLELDNDRLATSALEELITRKEADMIVRSLNYAFEESFMKEKSSTISMIGRILKNSCRELDPFLGYYGAGLLRGDFMGPSDWIYENREKYLENYHGSSIMVNAKTWVLEALKKSVSDED